MFRFHSSIFQECSGFFEHCFDFKPSPFIQSKRLIAKGIEYSTKGRLAKPWLHGGKTREQTLPQPGGAF